jgi:hypothetical protein
MEYQFGLLELPVAQLLLLLLMTECSFAAAPH